jgi:hypothetical protein
MSDFGKRSVLLGILIVGSVVVLTIPITDELIVRPAPPQVAQAATTTVTAVRATSTVTQATITSTASTTSTATRPASLLFWSGFEGSTGLATPTDCYSNGCWQSIIGRDTSTGFSWPPKIGDGTAQYQLLENASTPGTPQTIGEYMHNAVQTVTGHTGSPTKVMFSEISQSGCCGTATQDTNDGATQDPYVLLPRHDVPELYVSEWVRLQGDFEKKMSEGNGTWRALFEWKTSDTDDRLSLNIVTYNKTPPRWLALADSFTPTHQEFWRVEDKTPPVPVGKWFKIEVYWKRNSGADGRIWMAVDGHVIADKHGPNLGPNESPINRIMLTQLYSGSPYPISEWIDDVQIWSTFPTASRGSAWYDPPYAPH